MTLDELLKRAGMNQTQLAKMLGIEQPSVSAWRLRGIPVKRVTDIEKVTGIPRRQIRPDLYTD